MQPSKPLGEPHADQPDRADLAQSVLEDFGYRVLRAGHGREALEILEGEAPLDPRFTDLIMPGGIDGVVPARRARRSRRSRRRLNALLATG